MPFTIRKRRKWDFVGERNIRTHICRNHYPVVKSDLEMWRWYWVVLCHKIWSKLRRRDRALRAVFKGDTCRALVMKKQSTRTELVGFHCPADVYEWGWIFFFGEIPNEAMKWTWVAYVEQVFAGVGPQNMLESFLLRCWSGDHRVRNLATTWQSSGGSIKIHTIYILEGKGMPGTNFGSWSSQCVWGSLLAVFTAVVSPSAHVYCNLRLDWIRLTSSSLNMSVGSCRYKKESGIL